MQCPTYFLLRTRVLKTCPLVKLSRRAVLVACMRGLPSVASTVVAAALLAAAAPRLAWGDVRTAAHDDAPPEPRPFDLLA